MREPDFDSINETVACSLQNCEVVVIGWIRNYIVNNSSHPARRECHEEQSRVDESQRKLWDAKESVEVSRKREDTELEKAREQESLSQSSVAITCQLILVRFPAAQPLSHSNFQLPSCVDIDSRTKPPTSDLELASGIEQPNISR